MLSKYDFEDEKQRAGKRLKTCSFNYLEHKIKQEYGGGLVMRVNDDGDNACSSTTKINVSQHPSHGSKYGECSKYLDSTDFKTMEGVDETSIDDDSEFDIDEKTENSDDDKSGDSNNCSAISLSDLEGLLDEDLPEKYKSNSKRSLKGKKANYDEDFVELEKIVLDELGNEHFDLLPEGWIKVTHETGIPVYLDKYTRVVTVSRPYFLGTADLTNHYLPLPAIPCLRYRKRLESYSLSPDDCIRQIGKLAVPIAKVESVEENQKAHALSHEEIRQYCRHIFPFEKPDENSSVKKNNENVCSDKYVSPSLPPGTKLISFPILERDGRGNLIRRRDCVMNPHGKGYVALLHDYSQHALKVQPFYRFRELRSDDKQCKQEAVVVLNDEVLGIGYGNSKKEAKLSAAKKTLNILIPGLNEKLDETFVTEKPSPLYHPKVVTSMKTVFDNVKITDPRVVQLATKTTEPPPYSMLLSCLRRNYGSCELMFKYDVTGRHNASNKYTMIFKKHKVTVNCKNKQDGKQKAAQTMLQVLHPDLHSWGALIRLYGSKSARINKEMKQAEKEITKLQSTSSINEPNYAVLNKLFAELEKKRAEMQNKKPIPPIKEEDIPKFDD